MTRRRLLAELDAGEWAWWRRVYRLMPWGTPAEDERLALLGSWFNNAMGGKATPDHYRFAWGRAAREVQLVDPREGVRQLRDRVKGVNGG